MSSVVSEVSVMGQSCRKCRLNEGMTGLSVLIIYLLDISAYSLSIIFTIDQLMSSERNLTLFILSPCFENEILQRKKENPKYQMEVEKCFFLLCNRVKLKTISSNLTS